MAAPVATLWVSYSFRDAKGQTSKSRVLIGDATNAAAITDAFTLRGHLAAISNAFVTIANLQAPVTTRGAAGQFQNTEDKVQMLFTDPLGMKHRFRVPAPLAAIFKPDLETPDNTNAALLAVLTDFATFCYGHTTDTAALTYVGGLRTRSRFIRRFNLLTLDPSLTIPGE